VNEVKELKNQNKRLDNRVSLLEQKIKNT
jgi:ubiquinone biosynthesis protein UbiJ